MTIGNINERNNLILDKQWISTSGSRTGTKLFEEVSRLRCINKIGDITPVMTQYSCDRQHASKYREPLGSICSTKQVAETFTLIIAMEV